MTLEIRLACAAAIAAAGLAAPPAHAELVSAPGAYRAESAGQTCRLRLDAPASGPEDSLVVPETVSGLVLAFPGCPAGLSDAMLWRAPADGSALALIDGAGAVIATLEPGDGDGWTAPDAAGGALILRRD